MSALRKRFRIEGPSPAAWHAPAVATHAVATNAASPAVAPPDLDPIQAELGAMKAAIATMRREVGSLQRNEPGHAGVRRAACELDAVFDATERATTTILGAVEDIESAAAMLRAAGGPGSDYLGIIQDRVVLLYETCNFQDIAGQRIEKVIGTLKFVEERLDVIADGGSAGAAAIEAMPAGTARPSGEPALAGPALAVDDHNSQSEIDNYFG